MHPQFVRLAIALAVLLPASLLSGAAFAVTDTEINQAEAALKASPGESSKRAEVAKLHYLKGSDFSMRGDDAAAATEFKTALGVLEDRQSMVPEQFPVYEEVRYGLAFSDLALGQPQDAVVLLDQLVASSPRFTRARVLLGAALLRTASEAGIRRGLAVLAQVARELPGPDGTAATHTAARYAYNLALGAAVSGKAAAAVSSMQDVRDRFGANSGADAAENQTFQFGMGTFRAMTGNTAGALAEYGGLRTQNADYRLRNGVTLQQVLANTYYRAGLEDLSKGGRGASESAIAAFDNAEQYGSGKDADTHHGKALAYKQLNQPDNMAKEMAILLQLDPDYYKRIKIGS